MAVSSNFRLDELEAGGVNKVLTNNRGDLAERDFTYQTYSGADISAQILIPNEPRALVLGDLQTLSYSIHRETHPVRLVGRSNISGVTRGPRTVGGSLIFTNFEAYTFYRLQQYKDLINTSFERGFSPMYGLADMLPPFDILVTFSNEYGAFSRMRILGVTIMDEGTTMSVEDLVTESQYTYIARAVEPLTKYDPNATRSVSPEELNSGGLISGPGFVGGASSTQ